MATIVLGTVGRALGGPLGGIVGSLVGGIADRAIFGSGPARDGPRLGDLSVQSAAYGQPLPRLYGSVRIAGNVIWSSGIRESAQRSGGGKRGPSTTSYSYSASFAVALSARPVVGIGRIWADGKPLRDAAGVYRFPAKVRMYTGSESQLPDPLIVAAQPDGTPAYRGLAYAVFDDLPLADYGNRIPNLTFEVFADADPIAVDTVATDLAAAATALAPRGAFPQLAGYVAATAGTVRSALEPLAGLADLTFIDDGATLLLAVGPLAVPTGIAASDLGATASAKLVAARTEHRAAAPTVYDAVTIGFSDPARDYQYGLQRAVRRVPARNQHQFDLTAVLAPAAAKGFAEALLRRAIARRSTAEVAVPWRYAALRSGDYVTTGSTTWRIRTATLVGMVLELGLETPPGSPAGGLRPPDGGVSPTPLPPAQGATTLHVLDLPPLPGPLPTAPRLWLAAAGAAGWRRADILVSSDGGNSYAVAGSAGLPTVVGTLTQPLALSSPERWNHSDTVEVALLDPDAWLESAGDAAVLGGANLALIGDEIVQFATAVAVALGRFRLGGWLRGRRGTAAAAHAAGSPFILLDTARLIAFDPPVEATGTTLMWKAVGPGEDAASVSAVAAPVVGSALRPLAPVHLQGRRSPTGDWHFTWTRRSRAGFAWLDGVDAPLAEEAERYSIEVAIDGRRVFGLDLEAASLTYPASAFSADGGATARRLTLTVAQTSGAVGRGAPATLEIALPN